MPERLPTLKLADNVQQVITMKFDSAGAAGNNEYGNWFKWTVDVEGDDHTLFANDALQDLLEAASPERGTMLTILKDKPAGEKHAKVKAWRLHEGEWVEIDPRDAPSRKPDPQAPGNAPAPPANTPPPPGTPQTPPPASSEQSAQPKTAQKFEKFGTRPDLLAPVMAECLNQAAINYGHGSWLEALDKLIDEKLPAIELIQRLATSLFIGATDGRTVLPQANPMDDYVAPDGSTEQAADPDSTGDDLLPF
jgi:hypothetical protein